jgi:hypothetical protein
MSLRRAALAFFGGLLLSGCGAGVGEDEPSVSAGEKIAGGQPDSVHTAVFQLYTHFAEQMRVGACTATLIAPNLLLTARAAWWTATTAAGGTTRLSTTPGGG